MNTRELRREPRFPVSRRGELCSDGVCFPCLIQDVSDHGVGIICARDPVAGQKLELKFELHPNLYYQCGIEIRHVENGFLGSAITMVEQDAHRLYREFVRQQARALPEQPAQTRKMRSH